MVLSLKKVAVTATVLVLALAFALVILILLMPIYGKPADSMQQWRQMPKYVLQRRPQQVPASEPYVIPKIVWSYWNDENIPATIKKIMDQRAATLTDWKFNVLTDATIPDYLPNYPNNYHTLRQSHKSDWLRLALLEKYGGCWLDATIIVNSETAFEQIYNESVAANSEFTGFFTGMGLKDQDPTTFIESWFIMAPQGSRVIAAAAKEFTTACDIGFQEYRVKALSEHNFSQHVYNEDPSNVYLTVYAAIQMSIQKRLDKKVNIILYNSYDAMYKLHADCWQPEKKDYDSVCIVKLMRDEPEYVKRIPFLKFTNAQHALFNKIDVSAYFI